MKLNLECTWDENLRESPVDLISYQTHVDSLRLLLKSELPLDTQISYLGELGSRLRTLGHLEEAEQKIREALKIIFTHGLGLRRELQQKIHLAHVLQWKMKFDESNSLFSEVIHTCRTKPEAAVYLDFSLQHAAKNLFDQKKFEESLEMFEEALCLRKQRNAPTDQIVSTEHGIEVTKKRMKKADE